MNNLFKTNKYIYDIFKNNTLYIAGNLLKNEGYKIISKFYDQRLTICRTLYKVSQKNWFIFKYIG